MVERHLRLWAALLLAGALVLSSAPMVLADGEQTDLKMVFIETDSAAAVKKLAKMGMDIAAVREIGAKTGLAKQYRVEAVIAEQDTMVLERMGLSWREAPSATEPMVMAQRFGTQDPEPPPVYHSFDEPGTGVRDELYEIAKNNPRLTHLETIGFSHQGRPLLAMRLTKHPRRWNRIGWKRLKKRPEVLFVATHHAREWVATQMAMRLIKHLTEQYGEDDRITEILDTTQVWIVPVANPDGYQYTFTDERLWRKNMRDNDGDGLATPVDGVDLNRNFDSHWGLDDEGSSPILADYTYRGPEPNSEPETRALIEFMQDHNFKFAISYHTYSDLILYPWGWQVQTPCFDDPIFVAQAGTDENPAIFDTLINKGYDPGVGADLYTTNGDYTDWAYAVARVPSQTVELTNGYSDPDDESTFYGFQFPDDEGMVQTVFEDNLNFALSVMESGGDPAHPVSPVGIKVADSYHSPPEASWGEDQPIEVLAPSRKASLRLFYRINDGRLKRARFKKALGAEYNDQPGLYFTNYRATVRNQAVGDEVTYWILNRWDIDGPYTYLVESPNGETFGNPILIVSAEDYTGDYPLFDPPLAEPAYLQQYTDALDANGLGYDVWDTTQNGVPPAVELLSHYEVVIWYMGDDRAPTVPSLDAYGETTMAIRDFMNYYHGRLFASGQDLAKPAFAFGLTPDDFLQYKLGAFIAVDGGGMDPETESPFSVRGEAGDPIFDNLAFTLSNADGGNGADNQFSADTFLSTSGFLPQFSDVVAARYDRPVGPFDPHGGERYVYSQMADQSYKRLGGTFEIKAGDTLTFWTSFDIEAEWDFMFVEIKGQNEKWTTLADDNGMTVTEPGESCASGWVDQLHPHLANYMSDKCDPTGADGGQWNAFTGNSNGWQQVSIDLSGYAGETVELYISYASDWGTQGLGVFIDDITLGSGATEGFETDGVLGGWEVTSANEDPPFNNWSQTTGAGFSEGPVIRTDSTVLMGFGFEAIDTDANREAVMGRVMDYLMP